MDEIYNGNGAAFDTMKRNRFVLWRVWDNSLPKVMFIGLNPSKADEEDDDPTIRRVTRFAKDWGYGGVYMLNLFSFVTPYPADLQRSSAKDIHTNSIRLIEFAEKAEMVVFAWGNFKEARERSDIMAKEFPNAMALKINKNGSPRHPLYVPAITKPVKYE